MHLAIVTVSRPYLRGTLDSLRQSDFKGDVTLFVGSLDETYLDSIPDKEQFDVESMPVELWEQIQALASSKKSTANYLRIFEKEPAEDVFVAEDDIQFSKDWVDRLNRIKAKNPNSIISLYSGTNHPPVEKGWITANATWGACGIFYPRYHRQRFAKFIRARFTCPTTVNRWLTEDGEEWLLADGIVGIDQLLNSYLFYENHKVIVGVPSCIDHLGDVTTIEENATHGPRRAPTFNRV